MEKSKYKLSGRTPQTKIRVNAPGDVYEREADRVADQVMQIPDSDFKDDRLFTPVGSTAAECVTGGETTRDEAPQIVHDALSVPGRPLDDATRAFFEPRFGHDFGKVRVHTDDRAAESARAISAQAYTAGNNIVLGPRLGYGAMTSRSKLLAHELTHVVQQERANRKVNLVQRLPTFPDASCEGGKIKTKIAKYVAIALELVTYTVDQLPHPERIAIPLRRYFRFDPRIQNQMLAAPSIYPTLSKNLKKLQQKLAEAVDTYCEKGPGARGKRGWVDIDQETGLVKPESGITYNRNSLRLITLPRQIVNTIIHEYAHLAGIGHHQPPGEPFPDRESDSTKVRGLDAYQALNNAESYMRFVRAVTSKRQGTANEENPAQ
jgi:hypothetical protein